MDHTTCSKRCQRRLCKRQLVRSEGPDSSQCDQAQKPPVKRSRASAQQEVNARLCWQEHVPFHTHHKDGVLICDDFLAGHCLLGEECQQHHTPRPYHWQLRQTHTRDWVNVSELGQKHLEALFCNPDKTDITLSCENAGGQGDLVQRQHSSDPFYVLYETMDHTTCSKRCQRRLCKRQLVRSEGPDSSQCDQAQKPPVKRSRASAQQEVKARLCWQGHVPFHTHHKDDVLICDDFLAGHCLLGEECQQHHTPRPYHWQLRQTHTKDWVNVSELGQKHLEALFCNPDKTDITLSCENAGGQGDLVQRQHSAFSKLDLNTLIPQNNWSYNKVRRLATTSNTDLNPHFLTKWNLYWQELGKWKLYKEPVVSQLEAAFEKGMWNQAFMLDGNLYNVDLKKYTQCNIKTNFIREVRRRPQLISDTELWPLINQKKFMSRGLSSAELSQLELPLFHGTTEEAVQSICKNNFDPRISGQKHGSNYGQGTYFAKNASCSARYAIESKSGHSYMFLAMVLVGKSAVGKQSFRRPPPLDPDSPTSDLYNSCVDKEQQPQMFVIFDSCQCYPYFLIHYKKLTDTVNVF
ncbi:UNVERIFIED_CONTAM: hypothetical protein FKN15_031942 [Acipenser sinensis]